MKLAAQYVRMSTDHQQYSTDNQQDAIRRYADANQLAVVRSYFDEGKSGLSVQGRDGLQSLLDDVTSGRADYQVVLVCDVSRWGRFQDADESAYYEFVCRRARIHVKYCMEPFRNDGSPMSAVMKGLKRVMAAEYSRDLSARVFAGKCCLVRMGFRQGGPPGYGYRRMVIDSQGKPRGLLKLGEHKFATTDRVVLVPGPMVEQQAVQWIFRQVARSGSKPKEIARALNEKGLRFTSGRPWDDGDISRILSNEKYIGNNVFNRCSEKLKTERIRNPADQWVRFDGAFVPLVTRKLFDHAQRVMAHWRTRITNPAAIDLLRDLLMREGHLSEKLIDASGRIPHSEFYRNRFGSLGNAYALAGFTPDRDLSFLEGLLFAGDSSRGFARESTRL